MRIAPRIRVYRLTQDQLGQGLAEYIIITLLVAIILIFGVRYFGGSVSGKFQNATQEITGLQKDATHDASGGGATAPEVRETPSLPEGHESGGSAGPKAPSGGGENSDIAKLRPDSVGLKEQDPITSISVSPVLLMSLGGLVVLGGVAYLVRESKRRKGGKGKTKPKKKLFSLGERKPGKKSGSSAGQAMVEFVFVAITFLFVILGVIQLAMVLNAYALVRYAAYNAARAAIVHGGAQDKMDEAARLSLVATFPTHGRADHRRGFMENYLAAKATDHQKALPPDMGSTDEITEVKIVNPTNLSSGTVVTFDDPAERERPIITVEVTHYYQMVIPLVNRILFYIYKRWREGTHEAQTLDYISAKTDRQRRVGGSLYDIEYRIPIVAHYTMRLQSDYEVP